MTQKINILNIPFDNITLQEGTEFIDTAVKNKAKIYVVTPNAEIVYLCTKDEAAKNAISNAHLVVCDGVGVLVASKILKTPIKQKVAGFELGLSVMDLSARCGYKVYLLGGKPDIVQTAAEKLQAKFTGLIICGVNDGYFTDEDEIINNINEANPDILLVCLGAPKQELFMQRNQQRLNCTVQMGLGGSLDGYAGRVNRAPQIFINLGLEWFYRLLQQPSRFWRMLALPKFLIKVIFTRNK